jgi:hypothetical protein
MINVAMTIRLEATRDATTTPAETAQRRQRDERFSPRVADVDA